MSNMVVIIYSTDIDFQTIDLTNSPTTIISKQTHGYGWRRPMKIQGPYIFFMPLLATPVFYGDDQHEAVCFKIEK